MAFTEETILAFLLERGSKVTHSELLSHFEYFLDVCDPVEKENNRELFKRCVNSVAFVKHWDGVKYIVIKKEYIHLLTQRPTVLSKKSESEDNSRTQKTSFLPGSVGAQQEDDLSPRDGGETPSLHTNQAVILLSLNNKHLTDDDGQSGAELVQQRRKSMDSLKEEKRQGTVETSLPGNTYRSVVQKPYMLPLRIPPQQMAIKAPMPSVEKEHLEKDDAGQNLFGSSKYRQEARLLRAQSLQVTEGLKNGPEDGYSENVLLQNAEHEWLVKTALGHWTRVLGLLLGNTQLAQKRDFMSGFTALHWAAKSGNCEMIGKIIEISSRDSWEVDVNCKSYAGYTPLHIAAIHAREAAAIYLVRDCKANRDIRDNDGKKPCHYLPEWVSHDVRELLGVPRDLGRGNSQEHVEVDHHSDHAAGFNTISRLFQPHKKMHKRAELYTVINNLDPDN